MQQINSMQQFFSAINCHHQCYNMGRLVQAIEQATFLSFEQTKIPWQFPFLQQAWLAIIFWPNNLPAGEMANAHYVWFLKFPLDEQAKLNQAARDDFLRGIFQALETFVSKRENDTTAADLHTLEKTMLDNPYGFQPKEEQMANFHALIKQQFSLAASPYYHAVQHYLSDPANFSQWQTLGFQGIADFSARLSEPYEDKDNEQLITQAITHLPLPVFQAFAQCLENQKISAPLSQAIQQKLNITLAKHQQQGNRPTENTHELISLATAAVRANAQARDKKSQQQLIIVLLTSAIATEIELLATIAGRCWLLINHDEILTLFLEALAINTSIHYDNHPGIEQDMQQKQTQSAFNMILSDLMFIPGIRPLILQKFRSSQRSEQLSQAIGAFFKQKF